MATVNIPEKIYEKLKNTAEAHGVSVEWYVLSLIAESVDPTSLAESYWEASQNLMKRAKNELAKGDLRQAVEKAWGAVALALKSLAYKREGLRLSSHGELWEYVDKLVEGTHDEELGRLWRSVSSMHVNFYEGWATEKHVKGAIEDAENFIEKVKKLL
ncbi:MAG: PaREP1 family protein [Candidatus Bathyarchaeia archaeon]